MFGAGDKKWVNKTSAVFGGRKKRKANNAHPNPELIIPFGGWDPKHGLIKQHFINPISPKLIKQSIINPFVLLLASALRPRKCFGGARRALVRMRPLPPPALKLISVGFQGGCPRRSGLGDRSGRAVEHASPRGQLPDEATPTGPLGAKSLINSCRLA